MPLNTEQVRVAGSGHVYVAPKGTLLPTDLGALPAEWIELGYITTDGATFTMSRTTEDLNAWQGDKIRVLTSEAPMTVEFALMETSTATLTAALGGGTVDVSGGVATFTPPGPADNLERSMVLDFNDGTIHYRYCMQRVQIEGDVSWQLVRTDSVNYPTTWGILDASPRYTIISDDPAISEIVELPLDDPGGVVGGTPGYWTAQPGTQVDVPDTLAAAQALVDGSPANGFILPTVAWSTGQYVIVGTSTRIHWDDTANDFAANEAP